MNNGIFWKTKLAAWVHDPAEKALVLFREAHEAGTVRNLCRAIFGGDEIPAELRAFVKKADHWAAAADRPDLPWRPGERYPEWSKVRFSNLPELVHPVSPGVRVVISETFKDVAVGDLRAVSTDHFLKLLISNSAGLDMEKTFLRFWRFGPETPAGELNLLWQLLPADTRSPDHTIWDHLKLCSAFAGIFALGDEPALLVVSLGPVQGFISQSRSTSDLWAGSHFLSQLCWQAMLPVCEEYGPDAVLFPDLHGIPAVDQWLAERGIWPEGKLKPWERKSAENKVPLDLDPRMAAALPNRFVALVPARVAETLAKAITTAVRDWACARASEAAEHFFSKATGYELPKVAASQITDQMKDFPEVYWSVVPWSAIKDSGEEVDPVSLFGMMSKFLPENTEPGEGTWDLLLKPVKSASGEWSFYKPNRGAAYTHLYGLSERFHGAAKTVRTFEKSRQEGYRCTICGEREWLSEKRGDLLLSSGKRGQSAWTRLGEDGTGPVRKGEHLCAWCAVKRFWPSVFPKSVSADGSRFVVSTHTMALASSIERVVDAGLSGTLDDKARKAAGQLARSTAGLNRAAFPLRLWRKMEELKNCDEEVFNALAKIPVLLDCLSDETEGDEAQEKELNARIKEILGASPETYYALVLMDGDSMGAWVAGLEQRYLPRYRDILHSFTRTVLDNEFRNDKDIQAFLEARRPNTPARHQAISRALNHFSLHLARVVVEEIFTGKLIYAGGDDLFAMASVRDLPGLMLALRALYSGILLDSPEKWTAVTGRTEEKHVRLVLKNGYALLKGRGKGNRLFATMGPEATASIGAVIAHHKAPLARVIRSLNAAEKAAKNEGGRDAFCIALEKRSGSASRLVGKWCIGNTLEDRQPDITTMGAVMKMRDVLAQKGVSRRAVYVLHDVLRNVPPDRDALVKIIAHRLERQGAKNVTAPVESIVRLAEHHAGFLMRHSSERRGAVHSENRWLQEVFVTAEFFARRMVTNEGGEDE